MEGWLGRYDLKSISQLIEHFYLDYDYLVFFVAGCLSVALFLFSHALFIFGYVIVLQELKQSSAASSLNPKCVKMTDMAFFPRGGVT